LHFFNFYFELLLDKPVFPLPINYLLALALGRIALRFLILLNLMFEFRFFLYYQKRSQDLILATFLLNVIFLILTGLKNIEKSKNFIYVQLFEFQTLNYTKFVTLSIKIMQKVIKIFLDFISLMIAMFKVQLA
jgi:hypothetical protein